MLHNRDTKIIARVSRLDAELDAEVLRMLKRLDQRPEELSLGIPQHAEKQIGEQRTDVPSSRNVVNAQQRIMTLRQQLEQTKRQSEFVGSAAGKRPPMSDAASLATDAAIVQRFVDRNLADGLSADNAFYKAHQELDKICNFQWDALRFDSETKKVLVRAETPTSTSTAHERTPSEDGDATR